MSRFKDGFKTYHDAYFTILILIDDSRNDFSKFLLLGDVSLARNHDALGLRRAGTVERFRAVAYGGAAKTHVFDEAHDALPFFRWDVIAANKELLADIDQILEEMTYIQFAEVDDFLEQMVAAQALPHTDYKKYPTVMEKLKKRQNICFY